MGKDLFNDRISRFSIRKLNVGVCSVLLGTLVMVGVANQVSADETSNQTQVEDVTNTTAVASEGTQSQNTAATQASMEVANILSSSEANSQSQAVSTASQIVSEASTTPASSEATSQAAVSTSETSASSVQSSNSIAGTVNVASSTTGASTTASSLAATSESQASAPASEAQNVNVEVEASSSNSLSGGVESPVVEQPVVTAETSGKRRSRRSIADPNDPNLIADDVQDATSTPKETKPGFTTNIKATDLASQISWLDFGDTANWTGTTTTSSGNLALQVGSTYTKEIMPGYVVTIKVKSLKPFQATEIYKKRLENRGATEAEKATYDPNARNGYVNGATSNYTKAAFSAGEEAKVIAEAQNQWTEIRKEGINTGTKKTTISSEFDGGNIGVQFEISATFRGKVVKPAIVMADGESANPGELVMFTTNGEGWQHIGEWLKNNNKNTKTYIPQNTDNLFGSSPSTNINGMNLYRTNLDQLRRSTQVGPDKKAVAWKYFGSADLTTGGLGTGVFGPNISSSDVAVPLVMTKGASEIGLYIVSGGKQSAMFGFFPLDEGDAPESYGKAIHSIATVDGITGKKVNQPYLGHLSPDMDENNALDWFGDDNATTADEGVDQLLPAELKGTTNEMIKMDRTHPGNYTITLEAHTDGAPQANIYGWIDFNQNGTFDEDERSELATITKDGSVTLRFTKSKTYIDPSVNELGVRVRIAKDAVQIESPTGMAFSGEVEDFRTQVTHPPKGEVKETTGLQGEKQSSTVAFTARGLYKYSLTDKAQIDETVAPQMVDNRTGQVVTPGADGYYAVAGQGKYKITPNGTSVDVEFIPEDHFLGTADGISIRRTDTNGYDTGWSTKFPDMEANVDTAINTMDGLYIPTVTPKDIEGESKTSTDVQGATQTGTPTFNVVGTNLDGNKITVTPSALYPAKLVDPATGQPTNALSVTVAGEGTYTIDDTTGKVTFVPEPGFTGTANGVTVTLSAPVGRDKDGTIRDEYVKTATAKYTPTVTPITVTPTNKVSADVQNVPQTQTPTFDLSNDKTAQITSKKLVDPTTGQPTDDATVTVAGEGSYTIDPTTGAVTFTPEKDFVGTAKGVTVKATATITNENGKTATITSDATYTPTVVAAVPTAQPAKSKDIQGATQTGTPTFAGTTVQVNGQDKAITIKDNSYKLLDKDGNEVTGTTPAYAADGTTVIGNFSIDSATGTVTFTPTDKSYTGAVTPAKVQAESSNGIKVDTTYTPEIVPVSPTATPAESTDIQGATQTGKPEFQGGTVNVDGVDKTVAINEAVPATFDDGTKTKTIPNVGTYTVAADGTVTFVPEKSFVGTAPAVTVVREDMNGTKAQATYTPTVTPVKPTADPATSTGKQGQEQTGKPVFTEGNSRVPMNDRVAATFDDGSTTKTVPNVGTYTVAADGTVTFVPEKSFVGTAPAVTVVREDMNGTKAKATYTPTVTPVTPTATPAESTGPQGVVQTGTVTFTEGDPVAPIDKNTITLLDENGQPAAAVFAKSPAGVIIGTFTVDKITSVVTFTPSDKSYSGEVVPVKVRAADTNGTTVETTYTPKITPVVPTAEDATSTDIQGATQTGKPTFTEGDSRVPMDDDTPATFEDGSKTKTVDGVGTYTVAADGTVTFKPLPTYVGTPEGVTVKRVDKNGTAVTAKYTPTVTPVVPSATPAVSEDVQGATQTGKPEFTAGNSRVPMNDAVPATFDDGSKTKTVDGVGTYTVATDGTVTFVPEPSFTGTAPAVTVVREDMNGTKASATYTPTVNPVTVTPTNKVSEDVQNVPQTETPTFALSSDKTAQITSKKLVNPATGQPTDDATVTVAGEGSYTIDPTTGVVTFTPEKDFVGTAKGVTVQATATITNENGKTATITSDATYTPTVVAAVPTAQPAKSKDIQGATQTGTPTFAGTTVQVNGQDKAITIKDNSYKLLDKDGNEVSATPAYAADGTTVIGNFSIDSATGTVTFTPTDKSYTGAVTPAKVQAESSNGIKVDTTYTPEIVPVTPTATPAETTDIQGATQKGKPEFQGGTVTVDGVDKTVAINETVPATFDDGTKTKTVDGVGTYTVASDGTVTFVPEKSFTGTAPAVTVVREDMNGTKAQATYTPTVTPVKPTAEPATSTGKQGQTQTGKPEFTEGNSRVPMNDDVPATFDDGTTTKTVPNIGTYTVASDGTVTFVPEKSFTGEAPAVTVVREDMNGTKASATYTPTVTPVTPTATPAESTGPQGLVQTGTVTFTEGDPVAPINKDSITLLDENGQPAASVDAKSPAGDVIGTYTVDKETGVVTFTPTDKSYSGDVVPAKVQAADTNGTTVETTYTPKITPVVPTAEPAASTDIQGATQTGKPVFTEGNNRVPMDDTVPATFDDGSNKKTVDGVGTYTVASDGTVTFKPLPTYVGTPEGVTVKRVDKNGTPATATYTPTVTPVTPTATPAETSGVQGATQSGKPVFTEGDSRVPMNDAVPATFDDGSTSKTVDGIGTYTVAADGTVTFVPDPSFTGTAPAVTVVREDKNGTKASATYTPTVNPVTLTPTNKVSEDIQNVPQTETPTFALSDDETAQITSKKLIDPATGQPTDETSVTVAGEGTYTINPTTGAVTFTPEKDFVGTAKGVTVQATATITNEAGKTSTITSDASYTPTVVAAVPTAQPATSKDIQGATQTGTPTFAGTTVQVNGRDKTITIKDNSYTLLDNDGNEVSTTPAYAADGTTEIGTYSIDPATGQVTFTPTDKSYTGQVTPVKVQAESSNGIKVDTTYTPEIVPVTPTAQPAETTDIQGATQTGKPVFKGGTVTVDGVEKTVDINEDVPATFDDGSTTKTVDGVGTYTVAADGTVTFVPEKTFTGTAPAVTVVREDKNGTKASATYTPTVTPVTPTATPVETTDIQGATQTGKPVFTEGDSRVPMNNDVPATFDDGSTTKTVDGVGTYTVSANGTVTFVPEKSFTGKAPAVTVVREDKNGTKASATYTPTVTPVTPTATPVETTGKQGQTQTGKPEFTEGDSRVPMNDDVPATFDDGLTTKTVDGVGTYTVSADGTVTFVPEKSFTGKAPAVTVVREDKNGTKTSATYTPTVTPVTPTATPAESTGPQGLVQTGTVTFTEGDPVAPIDKDTITLLDENGQPAASVDAKSPAGDVIGTFTVDKETGVVTFTPTDKSYSGDVVPVKVQAADANGTTAETTYTPKITSVVPTSEDATSTDIQGQTQSGKPTFTEGNPNVPIDEDTPATFEDGSTTKTIPGEGTYTVSPDGTVTFVPEKSFTGTATGVTVKRVDKNGTKITAKYTPTVTPVTPTAEPATSTDIQGATQTGKPKFTEGDSRVPMNDDVPATFDDGSTTKTVDGVGTYTVAADGTVTFVPEKSFVGTAPAVTVVREDKNGTKASATYTPTVTPVTPTAEDTISTDKQGQTQSGTPTFTPGNPNVPMDDDTPATFEDGSTTKTIPGEGTYTVAPDGTVTFVPEKSFTGEGTGVTVKRVDKNGTSVTAKYTPTVTPVTPTATPAESTGPQGVVQTGTVTFTEGDPVAPIDKDTITLLDENGQPAASVDAKSPVGDVIGTFTVDKETGVVTFTPTDKSYSGDVVPVKVQAADANGTVAETTYTPKITPVVPTADPATSTDIQGQTQTGKPSFTPGNPSVPMDDDVPATFDDGSTTKTVEGVGTYTVAADGTVTFVPEKSFVGTAPAVTVVREDKNGTKASAAYTPTVTPVTPTATPAESTGPQGATQTGKPEFTEGDSRVPMNDDVPATFEDGSTTKTIPGEGIYTVAPDGTVTFVPEKSFTGTGTGVTVKRVDKNGTPVTATYTPTVTPVTPTATPTESTGPQGVVQTGTVTFTEGDPVAPIDKDTITLLDENGQPATSVIAKSPEGKEIGTYTVDKTTGVVTFTPTDKSYSGEVVPVKVQAKDTNGTPTETTYTPKITPVVPTADPVTSTDIQGQTQSGKPIFTPGNPAIPMDDDVPATFEDGSTTKTIPGEGTYTVAPDGTVTFVPEKSFTGTGTGVTVKRVDKNGTPVTATYTPTVTPVTPTAESTTSIGNKGQTQTGKPVFTEGDSRVPINDKVPATFDDGSTTKTIPGVGTYTVAADGTVTFTPEAEFTGTAPAVTVVREDVNGTKASATYTPTVRPITKFVDKEGKEIQGYPALDGEQPKAEISGYRFVETKKLPNGDFEHVYEKVTTSYVDENGTPIPGYPTEEGQQPKKDIPGYEFVKTVVDENGNTQHIYKKTVTPTPVPDSTPTPEPQPTPQAKQEESVLPETKEEASFINPTDENAQLPKTGSEDSNLAIFGLASLLAGFGLYGTKRRKR
ncbi:GEVED domain-containing protein [Streptococcus raffinosi]|uniref:CshA/CshB family fibrillar adhesin-related protein n=1 Tax=Streptococcus raffinosi TaxID=3053355 RepID=A0ABT7LU16_9STRE|nr:GEVED domain-containing protein [Streptococcus sp. VTCC 12812]MDL5044101.1 CshA/CshB family fibrillar adhesin-related protein [Streptococcus sp. VTCC 12812]